jgi:UDP-N-acetylglucosamine 4-epimerase
MTLTGKKLLVTGGAGFIGSALCEYFLKNKNKVVCIDNLLTGKLQNIQHLQDDSNFTFIQGDIRDYQFCKEVTNDIDIVFHQAALGSVPRSIENPITTNEINISGFLNIINASKEAGVKRFIYAASSSTYGDSKSLPKEEDVIGKPLSPYAITKYVNELYAANFSKLYGMETIGLRYFNVFGRRQDPNGAYAAVIPKFIDLLMNKQSPVINGDGKQTRDFTYIDNVIQANELAALTTNKEALNTIYNVAYGENVTLVKLFDTLKDIISASIPEVKKVEVQHGPDRVGDIQDSLASIEKAKKMLGYNPQYNLYEGLKLTVAHYLNK